MSYVLHVTRSGLAEQRQVSEAFGHRHAEFPIYIACGDLATVQEWVRRLYEFGLIDRAWIDPHLEGEDVPTWDDNARLLVDALLQREAGR